MLPVLFHLGSFPVRSYALAVAAALLAGTWLSAWLGRRRGLAWAESYYDFAFWALLGGLAGARLWEVAFDWSYYRTAPALALAFWQGGLSIQGGVLGGVTAAWLFTRRLSLPLPAFLDGLTPGLLLGQAIGRLFGCAMNGDAFGKPTGTAFGIVHAPGTMAHMIFGEQRLWPAEIMEGIFDLVLLGILVRLAVRQPGQRFALYVLLYSAGRFALEFLRADTAPAWGGLTPAQVGSLAAALLATLHLYLRPALRRQA